MSRQIKFRAWNEWADRKEMIYFSIDEPKAIENTAWNAITMQYTGMNDAESNEIYEGDIVELTKGNIVVKGQIVFEIGAFAISMHEDNMAEIYGFNWNDNIKFLGELYWDQDCLEENVIECLKVIGNIYENPGLLEGEE